MKLLFLGLLSATLGTAAASDVGAFNQVLVDTVRRDLNDQNDHRFHEKKPLKRRTPASVIETPLYYEDQQIEKHRQFGPKKW